ncbi:alpha/beta hydrolase [Gemmatimonadota bacterium]
MAEFARSPLHGMKEVQPMESPRRGGPSGQRGKLLLHLLLISIPMVTAGCSGDVTAPGDTQVPDFSWQPGAYNFSSFVSGARGRVFYSVYLPLGWTSEGSEAYPLIFYLHGQGGNEGIFPREVPESQLNRWISWGLVPPFVVVALRAAHPIDTDQWYDPENVTLLTSEGSDELRAFCWNTFRAGGDSRHTSVHGQSRGASGALYFALNHWDKFASAVANAFVSDYALSDHKQAATLNRDAIVESGILLRMTIGSEDEFAREHERIGSFLLDAHLTTLGIPHEFEVLPGVGHGLSPQWFFVRPDGKLNGLHELQLHARAWAGGR